MFKLIIEGKEVIPTTTKNYNSICQGINIMEWLKCNNHNVSAAADFFDLSVKSLRRKLYGLGYKKQRHVLTKAMVESAILEHIETGCVDVTSKESGFTVSALGARMRQMGYSREARNFVETAKTQDKPEVKVSWANILYNPMLSYREVA